MATISMILSILTGLLKVLPMVINLYNELKKNADMVATQRASNTALERFNAKQKATSDFIKQHTTDAISKLQGNTSTFTKANTADEQQSETNRDVSN